MEHLKMVCHQLVVNVVNDSLRHRSSMFVHLEIVNIMEKRNSILKILITVESLFLSLLCLIVIM